MLRLQVLLQRDFVRAALVLLSGTALAQFVMLLALPFLTRLYSPEDFGVLALYLGVISIVAPAACLGFDMAIAMPSRERDALHLVVLAILGACAVTLVTAAAVLFWSPKWFEVDAVTRLYEYRWLLPVGVLVTALFTAAQFYAVRSKAFKPLSFVRVVQTSVGLLLQIVAAFLSWVPGGLLVGQMLATGGGVFYWLPGLLRLLRMSRRGRITISRLKMVAHEYRRFPQFTTFESLANNIGIQLPVILIAMWLAGPEAGFLLLAMRVMQTPIGMLGSAIGQVYLSQAPAQRQRGTLAPLTSDVLSGAAKVGVAPLVCLGVVAPGLFEWLFGQGWGRAGELVEWMVPWMILQSIASPISMVMHVRDRQRMMLLLTCLGLMIRLGSLLLSVAIFPTALAEAYIVSGAVFYALCLWQFGRAAGLLPQHWWRLGVVVLAGIVSGLLVGVLFNAIIGW